MPAEASHWKKEMWFWGKPRTEGLGRLLSAAGNWLALYHTKYDRCQDQNDRTTDAGRNLCVAHQIETLAGRKDLQVARAAAVGHTEAGGHGTFNEVEAKEAANETGTDDSADNDHESDEHGLEIDGGQELTKIGKGDTDTAHTHAHQRLGEEGRHFLGAFLNGSGDDIR